MASLARSDRRAGYDGRDCERSGDAAIVVAVLLLLHRAANGVAVRTLGQAPRVAGVIVHRLEFLSSNSSR